MQLVIDCGLGNLWLSTTNTSEFDLLSSSSCTSGLSGLSFIELYSDFGEALLSSPDSRDSRDELSRILLQSASNESAETSKYSSSSATALADEFETFRMTLILGSDPLGRGVDDLSDASVSSSLADEMSINSYISSRWVIFFKKFFLSLQLTFIF